MDRLVISAMALRTAFLLAFLLASLPLACRPAGPAAAPEQDEMALVWEAWRALENAYVDPERLEAEAIVGSILQGLLDLAQAPPYPFLTEVGRLRGQPPPGVPASLTDVWWAIALHQKKWPHFELADLRVAAISGMVAGLEDPAAAYLDAEAYPRARESRERSLKGSYLGIGARVVAQDGRIHLFPYPDTPAAEAGIQPGDVLLEVQGEPLANRSVDEVADKVGGPVGSTVRLRTEREGEPGTLEYEIVRAEIDLPSVSRRLLPGGIGYIRIDRFRGNTGGQVRDALESLRRLDMLALILDVRSNPGGSMEAASQVAGYFLPPGSVFLREESRDGIRTDRKIAGDARGTGLGDLPMVVLVNQGTVGAAEALAGALQDTDRAILVGTRTAGQGASGDFVELGDGSALYIPTARWYTPSGKPLHREGVHPDLWVPSERENTGPSGESQINRAYEYLNRLLPAFR